MYVRDEASEWHPLRHVSSKRKRIYKSLASYSVYANEKSIEIDVYSIILPPTTSQIPPYRTSLNEGSRSSL
jgi:hypothetical protein